MQGENLVQEQRGEERENLVYPVTAAWESDGDGRVSLQNIENVTHTET